VPIGPAPAALRGRGPIRAARLRFPESPGTVTAFTQRDSEASAPVLDGQLLRRGLVVMAGRLEPVLLLEVFHGLRRVRAPDTIGRDVLALALQGSLDLFDPPGGHVMRR